MTDPIHAENEASEGMCAAACWPPINEDADELPQVPLYRECPQCGRPAPVFSADVVHFADAIGLKMWRVRILTRCPQCKTSTPYRMSGYVVEVGEYVKATIVTTNSADNASLEL